MGDLISRKELIADIKKRSTSLLNEWDTMGVLNIVYSQPPAQQWIPVEERLPEEDVDVLLCIKDLEGNYYQTITYFHIVWQTEVGGIYSVPVAWMPLPEPYKGE